MESNGRKKILVAPLNWGLGHATRCIPIINALLNYNFEPIIASDGDALELLKKEFPELKDIELPSYNITYPKKGNGLRKKLLSDSPHFMKTLKKERRLIKKLASTENLSGIISDNRFGIREKGVPSVFITHQLKVLSGSTTWLSTKLHRKIISKFDECWVPDHKGANNLSGDLGHRNFDRIKINYIGPLSRFKKQNTNKTYDLLVLLSGPEPQRTILEQNLFKKLEAYEGTILFVRGLIEPLQKKQIQNHITIYNYMTTQELEKAINKSTLILSRSGYTTIMDLANLEKKAFFIPTPGQFEQEYLANRLNDLKIIPSSNQDDFKIEILNNIEDYSGFKSNPFQVDFENLFSLF